MTARTSEKLARALEDIGQHDLADRARRDEFHDFLSPHDTPCVMLVNELAMEAQLTGDPIIQKRILNLRAEVVNGAFDASTEESDDWAKSPEGQQSFGRLIRGD